MIVNCDKKDCIYNDGKWCDADMIDIEVLECATYTEKDGDMEC